ncbi:hypothetical protein PBS_19770 [Paraburkholderia sp. 2C]
MFELREVLRDGLARHGKPFAELNQRLAVALMEPVEQQAAARVGKGTKNGVVVHVDNRQLFGCVSRTIIVRARVL